MRTFSRCRFQGLVLIAVVTATFAPGEKPPVDLLCEWIDESYRTIAPKKLVKQWDEVAAGTARQRAGLLGAQRRGRRGGRVLGRAGDSDRSEHQKRDRDERKDRERGRRRDDEGGYFGGGAAPATEEA